MKINEGVQFPVDSSAKILTAGLLGDQYVGIEPGSDDKNLANGDLIKQTQSAIVLENLIGQMIFNKAADTGGPSHRRRLARRLPLLRPLPRRYRNPRNDPLRPGPRPVAGRRRARPGRRRRLCDHSRRGSPGSAHCRAQGSVRERQPKGVRVQRHDRQVRTEARRDRVYQGHPLPVRTGVHNFFGNFSDAWSAVNQLLQGKPKDAGTMTLRVLTNTTIGIVGLFDPATSLGFERKPQDLGLTLGHWGLEPGPYVVLPLFGASDIRDGIALPADTYVSPALLVPKFWQGVAVDAVGVVDARAGLLGASQMLDELAFDRYTFVRDAYITRRRSLVYDGNPPDLPDYDDGNDDKSAPAAAGAASGAQSGLKPVVPASPAASGAKSSSATPDDSVTVASATGATPSTPPSQPSPAPQPIPGGVTPAPMPASAPTLPVPQVGPVPTPPPPASAPHA